ncbi:hypothetical protein D1BOALGB6SA_3797 [Olavius sp. associated proteobacterium Delta 1]|nr:hypothetical protein D1BOALGB6SA_3797 [Olavius sp. associated proteobacterium Delta 1]
MRFGENIFYLKCKNLYFRFKKSRIGQISVARLCNIRIQIRAGEKYMD